MEAERYGQIPLTKIDRDPLFQVRQHWDPDRDPTLPQLVQSLQDPEGQIHPIVVVARTTPTTFGRTHTLITGHRRLAAASPPPRAPAGPPSWRASCRRVI